MEAITLPHIQDGSMGILSRRPQFSAAIIEMKKIGKVVVPGFICKWEGILCHNCEGENRRTIFAFCILFLGMHPSYLQEHFKKKSGSIMKRESCKFETASNLGSRMQKKWLDKNAQLWGWYLFTNCSAAICFDGNIYQTRNTNTDK